MRHKLQTDHLIKSLSETAAAPACFTLDDHRLVYRSTQCRADGWGRIELFQQGKSYCLRCRGVVAMYFQPEVDRIGCLPAPGASPDLIARIVEGPFRAVRSELRGFPCLHASSVTFGSGLIGFVGHSGYGKTTLAQHFVSAGSRPAGDDILIIDSNTARAQVADGRQMPREHWIGPVSALFILDRQPAAGRVTVRPLSVAERMIELVRYSYCAAALSGLKLDSTRFGRLAHMARRLPTYRLTYPNGLAQLDHVHAAISNLLHRESF